jgi:DNA repair protein RadC
MKSRRLVRIFQQLNRGRRPFRTFPDLNSVTDYLVKRPGAADVERLRVLFLGRDNRLLKDEIIASGTRAEVALSPRLILTRALELGATGMVLVHNHPSGDRRPSSADIEATRQLSQVARALDIIIHDHVILARKGITSFRALGLM